MISREIFDARERSTGRLYLPFFSKTADSKRLVYYCRSFSLEPGAQVVIYSESHTVQRFMYLTGRIQYDIMSLRDYVMKEINGADDADAFKRALATFDESIKAKLKAELAEQRAKEKPIHQSEENISVRELERLLELASSVEKKGVCEVIAHTYDTFVIFDGTEQRCFGTNDELEGGYRKMIKFVEAVMKKAVAAEGRH